jgi:hypothetical protein
LRLQKVVLSDSKFARKAEMCFSNDRHLIKASVTRQPKYLDRVADLMTVHDREGRAALTQSQGFSYG